LKEIVYTTSLEIIRMLNWYKIAIFEFLNKILFKMKILKKIMIVVVALAAIYIVLALVGPSNYKVSREIKIAASIDDVFNQTTIYANWAAWSAWAKADTAAKYIIENDNQVVGATMGWEGEISGKGSMTTTEIVPNEKFIYELSFVEPFTMTSHGGFLYEQDGDSVLVKWYDEGVFGFMIRPMMLFMDIEGKLGPMFEQGLADMKKICESISAKSPVEIIEMEVEQKAILFIKEYSELSSGDTPSKIGTAYGEIGAFIAANELTVIGMPITITNDFSMKKMTWDFDCAMVIDLGVTAETEMSNSLDALETTGRIETGLTYFGKVVKATHIGPNEQSIITYNAIEKYITNNGLEKNGRSWEEYIDDPTLVAPEEVRTFIYFPVK